MSLETVTLPKGHAEVLGSPKTRVQLPWRCRIIILLWLSFVLCDMEWASPSAVEALMRFQWRKCLTLKIHRKMPLLTNQTHSNRNNVVGLEQEWSWEVYMDYSMFLSERFCYFQVYPVIYKGFTNKGITKPG